MTATARRPRYVPVVVSADELRGARLSFEADVCGRCEGRGRLEAFSGVMGGVCFGCGGSGERLTRAGKAAQARYLAAYDALLVRYDELAVGDRVEVFDRRHRASWTTVESVDVDPTAYAGSSLLGKGVDDRELETGVAYYSPLPGHRLYRAEYDLPGRGSLPWVEFTGTVVVRTSAGQVLSGTAATRVRRYDAELVAAAWTAALSKRGASVERAA